MKRYKVIVASTIYYEAIVESNSEEDIYDEVMNGEEDFTTWNEIDLESSIESIQEVK